MDIPSLIKKATTALMLILAPMEAVAQSNPRFDIHFYGGGFFPTEWAGTASLKDEGLYGVRAGIYVTPRVQIEGSAGYINHFRFEDADMGARALLWEVDGSYRLPALTFDHVEPFVIVGLGAATAYIRGPSETVLLLDPTFRNPESALEPAVLNDGDTFLTLNYGGGFKASRLWGPVGLRADLRVRTMPSFFAHTTHWIETTAGFTVAWPER
jgi:hypothetical protein